MVLAAIKKRRSYRDFQPQQVEKEKLNQVLKAAMFAPSANHQRPWEFIIIKDQKTKDLLAQTKQWSYFVNRAPIIIAVLGKIDPHNRYWLEDGCIAAENIYLEAENQGLGTCFVQIYGSKRDNGQDCEAYVKKILKIPANIGVLCLMPLGYPKQKLPPHSDSEFEPAKIHWEKY